ncbi:MAG: helicase RepA family protein [Lachnospiraceae bacterium]|nr:helicase RepA family protein [Lachnospiraceae bacterium]
MYFALEDTERRLQSRFSNYDISLDDMANIQFLLKTENIDNGFVEYTIEYLSAHPEIKLVVIDTLQHIRGKGYSKNIYEADVKFMEKLREITNACDVSILLLHHSNKGSHDDIINAISGSEGLAAGSDGNWVLYKEKRTDTRAKITYVAKTADSLVKSSTILHLRPTSLMPIVIQATS